MRVYLDHAATTPLDPRVRKAMEPYLRDEYGNPSSLHRWGRRARTAIDAARETLAAALNADPAEICFVSSGTESCNLAVIGCALKAPPNRRHILVSAVEHHCVLNAAEWLVPLGFEVEHIPVDRYGQVDPDAVRARIRDDTWLVSVMHANNEIGTLQPVEAIAQICKERGVWFHVDAVQTFGVLPVDVQAIGCDLLSVSAHKIYGPKGVGALYIRAMTPLQPLMVGGGQERGRRAGTENVAGIVGFAEAVRLAESLREAEAERQAALRDQFIRAVLEAIPDTILTGHPTERLPGNAHFRFIGVPSDSLLIALDRAGIAASSGAACSAGSLEPSHVLLALGWDEVAAQEGVRFTLGRGTTWEELAYTVEVLRTEVARIRARRAVTSI
ncbi:MAG: cysteine desulfurase [Fimbriimonadales bacterium]|nr:cysteine desulfurase [Fimbriimonadales bacterium]MDW8051414.1 cysteine desulfurase family protein [Armatimonadota bacterium]